MARRHKLSKRSSRKVFKAGALRTKSVNNRSNPMRGGFRL